MRLTLSASFSLLLLLLSASCQDPEKRGRSTLAAYVANAGSNHVQVVDLATGETVRKIYSGVTPWRLVPSPTKDEIWVQHWLSETTAVIDLAEHHEVRAVLPVRGPGIFDETGQRFLSFSWPRSTLAIYDAHERRELETRRTEVSRVYDFAFDASEENLFFVQNDPVSPPGGRQRYAYLVSFPMATERPTPRSVPTGRNPVQVLTVPGQPFVLTADSGTGSLSLLNIHGDGRTVPACRSPRQMLLDAAATRLAVLCWDPDSGRHGHAVSYRTDFTARPWPKLIEDAAVEIDAGLVAGALTPDGESVWVVDQPGRRLLELDLVRLSIRREIATGEIPMDVALLTLRPEWRARLEEKSPGRQRVEKIVARLQAAGAPFSGVRWTESISWDEAPDDEAEEPGDENSLLRSITRNRRLQVAMTTPARLRRQAREDTLSLAAGAWSLTVRRDGRFWTAPRQEVVSLLYALPNFEPAAALRRLAGDVSGSPYLSGGLAVDLSAEIQEEGRSYFLVGALDANQPVTQLWVDMDTGRPTNLIEKFPAGAESGHGGATVGGFFETRFYDFKTYAGGVVLPSRLERTLDGRWLQHVTIEDVEVDPDFAAADFDLTRLGGFARPNWAATVDEGPVAILKHGYIESPWEEHAPYNSHPPTSGPRLRSLASWGTHELPVPPELAAHNLEHGGVTVQYNCPRGCPDLVARLETLTAPYARVIVAPYPWMDARIALAAWGRFQTLDEADEDRILSFLEAWEGQDHHATDPSGVHE